MNVDGREPADGLIVVGVDGSDTSLHALEWAARQAELTGSTLEVITTWEWPTLYAWTAPIPYPEGWDPQADTATNLDEMVDRLRQAHPGLLVRARVAEGHPAPVLIDASQRADLLVVGSRGHGEFSGMLLGSVGQHCVTHAHCPVLVVRDRHWQRHRGSRRAQRTGRQGSTMRPCRPPNG
jgi:nucleotide-binding universal stress UspA family protein